MLELRDVVVTGTRVLKLLDDTPVETRVITAEDIERADVAHVADLLQQEMPGAEFSYAMNQQTHFNLGGFGGQSVLFLVDGERMAGETMDDVDFTRMDMSNVQRIEIVRGAASALYGSNAGGGVINVLTREPSKPWALNLDARVARHNEQRYGLVAASKGKWVANTLEVNHTRRDNYDVKNDATPPTRVVSTIYGHDTWHFKEKLTFTPGERLRLSGRAAYFFRQLPRTPDAPERYRDYSAGLKAEWDIARRDLLEVAYAFDQYDKSTLYRRSQADVRTYSNVQNNVRALFHHADTIGNVLTLGADFMRDYLSNRNLQEGRRARHCADAFVQYDRILSPRWEMVGALRYDYFSDGGHARFTPRLSARYKPLPRLNVRLAYGMGFRAPSLKERYYDFDMAGIWIVRGNPKLVAETSHNVNVSADYAKGRFNFTLSTYYNAVENKIATGVPHYLDGEGNNLFLDYTNLADYSVWGGEATMQARWSGGLSARLSYAYTREHLPQAKDGCEVNSQYMPARRHSLTARVDWEHSFSRHRSLLLSLNGRFLSSIDNNEYVDYYDISAGTVKVTYPAYTLWKFSAVQTLRRGVKVSVAVDNILNYKPRYHYLNSPPTDGANLILGLSVNPWK